MPGYEIYNTAYTLEDQTSVGGVLEFSFTGGCPKQIWVCCVGDDGRAQVNGETPTSTNGVFCGDGVPTPIPVAAEKVNVYAPASTEVSVWGFG